MKGYEAELLSAIITDVAAVEVPSHHVKYLLSSEGRPLLKERVESLFSFTRHETLEIFSELAVIPRSNLQILIPDSRVAYLAIDDILHLQQSYGLEEVMSRDIARNRRRLDAWRQSTRKDVLRVLSLCDSVIEDEVVGHRFDKDGMVPIPNTELRTAIKMGAVFAFHHPSA